METLKPILAEHPFFKDLEDRYLELIVGCASNVRFNAGDFIFRQGQDAHQFYLIREGVVALEVFAAGRGSITVETLEKDDILGWSWLVAPYRWMFDAHVYQPMRAFALDGQCLRRKSEEDHDFGYELLKRFSHIVQERLEATRLQLLNFYEVNA